VLMLPWSCGVRFFESFIRSDISTSAMMGRRAVGKPD
jgi:hypothetical protein